MGLPSFLFNHLWKTLGKEVFVDESTSFQCNISSIICISDYQMLEKKKNSFNLRRTFRKYITNLYRNYDISRNPFVQFFIGLHWLILAEWMFSALYRLNGCLSLLNRLMSIEKYGLRYYATPEWTKVSLNSTLYRTRLFYLFNFFLVNDGGHKIQKKKTLYDKCKYSLLWFHF